MAKELPRPGVGAGDAAVAVQEEEGIGQPVKGRPERRPLGPDLFQLTPAAVEGDRQGRQDDQKYGTPAEGDGER